ncbi:hypothetical protein [Acetobacter sp. DsW_063]|uniref:hypothetical protein n=1 Tax=Acetobacter sp. DsW_063 TaxID=1514894 RepID=UPI0011789C64|nr:hypothetical protein [Acetobacter sp. DsW_063]
MAEHQELDMKLLEKNVLELKIGEDYVHVSPEYLSGLINTFISIRRTMLPPSCSSYLPQDDEIVPQTDRLLLHVAAPAQGAHSHVDFAVGAGGLGWLVSRLERARALEFAQQILDAANQGPSTAH